MAGRRQRRPGQELRAQHLRRPGRDRPALRRPPGLDGATGTYEWDARDTDDFVQAGDLYRLQPPTRRPGWSTTSPAGSEPCRPGSDGVVERSIAHFRAADPEFGERINQGVKERRG